MTGIYCRTVTRGKQGFYLRANGKDYLLFVQNFRISNKERFENILPLSIALKTKGVHSTATLRTIGKLHSAIKYIEKEYDLCVLNKTQKGNKAKASYKRQRFTFTNEAVLAV